MRRVSVTREEVRDVSVTREEVCDVSVTREEVCDVGGKRERKLTADRNQQRPMSTRVAVVTRALNETDTAVALPQRQLPAL